MAADDSIARTVLLVGVVLVFGLLLVSLLSMTVMMPMMGGFHGNWNGTTGFAWPWLVGWGVHVLLLLAVGYALYRVLAGSSDRPTEPRGDRDQALEELRIAYARGEISSEEFEERRERLEGVSRSDE
ncbi:SHOCT domain-containing protein [Natronobacterium texcoconense]|uniref:SHOCT domain-containing protein n=1 Tax=Natronobacterium texcoconense TaxID=1095778 RepID=UPI000B85331B|nr:SHOCT domain-containing protein [Natronobacterium texcoconense]